MTATRDRRSDLDHADKDVAWNERALLNSTKGWPWWGVVLFAFGLSIVGAIVDNQLAGELGTIFHAAYFIGCVGAISVVRRDGMFGPMVQPPLILGVTVPATVLSTSSSTVSGLRNQLLTIGAPLINGFPAMALTTGITVGIGLLRIFMLQPNPHATARRGRGNPRASNRGPSRGTAARNERRGQRTSTAKSRSGTGRTERQSSARTTSRGGGPGTGARTQRGEPRRRTTDRDGNTEGRSGGTGRGGTERGSTDRGGTSRGVNPAREHSRQPRPRQSGERRRPSDGEQR